MVHVQLVARTSSVLAQKLEIDHANQNNNLHHNNHYQNHFIVQHVPVHRPNYRARLGQSVVGTFQPPLAPEQRFPLDFQLAYDLRR